MLDLTFINSDIVPLVDQNKGVRYCNGDFIKNLEKWTIIDLCLQDKIVLEKQGEYILPMPTTDLKDNNLKSRYKSYWKRAVWYGATRRTLRGLVGEVFANPPAIVGIEDTALDPLILDADGGGITLEQQARSTLTRAIAFGRVGIFVDYPRANVIASYADQLRGKLQPVIMRIDPQNVINWRTQQIGSKRMLTLIVIRENYVSGDDGFKEITIRQWRVLKLVNVSGQWTYMQDIWREDDKKQPQLIDSIIPYKPGNIVFDYIPFTFVGPDTNEPECNDSPMYDMAELNIAHFRNSADYEEQCFFCGQVTPVFTGLTTEFIKEVDGWKDASITIGSRRAIMLPPNGTAEFLQATANTMPMEAMKHKEELMITLGAKLVQNASATKTATQDVRQSSQDSSVLASCAVNVSAAFTAALKWAADYVGLAIDEIEYTLSTNFTTSKMTFQDRAELIKEWQTGAIAFEEMRAKLLNDGVAYLNDKDAKTIIEAEQAKEMANAVDHAAALSDATAPVDPNPQDNNA